MNLHKIFPNRCVEHLVLNDHSLECAQCGQYVGSIYEERLCLLNGFKKFYKEIQNSRAVETYSKLRDQMDDDQKREWRNFLRDLKFDEDEIHSVETTDEWLPEDCEWGNTAGC